jgi:hypothetical protein
MKMLNKENLGEGAAALGAVDQRDGLGPTIMGADGNIFTALDTLCQRHSPQAIVLLSTGLAMMLSITAL